MARKKPNAWQKLIRGAVRDIIHQPNASKPSRQEKSSTATNSNSKKYPSTKNKKVTNKSRYISKSVRVTVFNRDNYKCVFCGRNARQIELQIDHIIPFSKGGSNDISNLQTLCVDCNLGKSDRIL